MINNVITSTIINAMDSLASIPTPLFLYNLGINNGQGVAVVTAFMTALFLMCVGMIAMVKGKDTLGTVVVAMGIAVFASVLGLGFLMSCVAGSI